MIERAVDFRIVEETADVLPEYGSVPIGFEVNSRFRVERVSGGLGGIRLIEEAVKPPYIKDYDEPDGPERLARRSWDLSNWFFLGAFRERERIGGAIVAFHGDDVNYCEGREDLAGLWDIRVRPGRIGDVASASRCFNTPRPVPGIVVALS